MLPIIVNIDQPLFKPKVLLCLDDVSKSLGTGLQCVSSCSISILKNIGNIFHFPTRYLGAKTWSIPGVIARAPGVIFRKIYHKDNDVSLKQRIFSINSHYSYKFESLPPQQTSQYLKYVFALVSSHIADCSWTHPFGYHLKKTSTLGIPESALPNNILAKDYCFFNPQTGLKVTIFEKDNEVIIAFGGLKSYETEIHDKDIKNKLKIKMRSAIALNLLGFKPSIYEESEMFLKAVLECSCLQNKKVVLTGQCYGGAIASYLGIKHQISTICFNSVPLGVGLQQDIGEKKLLKAHKYITHISVKNDFMSDAWQLSIPDRFLTLLGIRTPGNFGKRYCIPSAFNDIEKTHAYVSGSMMKHVGLNSKTKTAELPPGHPIFQA